MELRHSLSRFLSFSPRRQFSVSGIPHCICMNPCSCLQIMPFLSIKRKNKPLCAQHISSSERLLSFCEAKDILLPQLLIYIILHISTTVSFKTVLEMHLQYKVFNRNKFSQNIRGRIWPYFVPVKKTTAEKWRSGLLNSKEKDFSMG